MKKKLRLWFVFSVLFALFIWFVWPTVYQYDHLNLNGIILPVRIHRISGKSDILYPSGWQSTDSPTKSSLQDLLQEELSLLSGNAWVTNYGWIKADIYNGTKKNISEITVEIIVMKPEGGIDFTRQYRLTTTGGHPLSSSEYIANAGFSLAAKQKWSWSIVSAKVIKNS